MSNGSQHSLGRMGQGGAQGRRTPVDEDRPTPRETDARTQAFTVRDILTRVHGLLAGTLDTADMDAISAHGDGDSFHFEGDPQTVVDVVTRIVQAGFPCISTPKPRISVYVLWDWRGEKGTLRVTVNNPNIETVLDLPGLFKMFQRLGHGVGKYVVIETKSRDAIDLIDAFGEQFAVMVHDAESDEDWIHMYFPVRTSCQSGGVILWT